MNKTIIIDGGLIMHRSIFAYMNNQQVPGTYTYLRMIIGYLKRIGIDSETKIIIAQDYGKSWRKDIDTSYKAQRKEKREEKQNAEWWKERYGEFDDLFEKLDKAVSWHFVKIHRIEADDIASVACRYYKDNEVILISSDRDWEMLCQYSNVKIFSPISKKYKQVKNPMKVLLEKIQGDISDNLLTKPSSEAEFEKRKQIVNLLELPLYIEQTIKETFDKIMPKTLYLHKVPFHSIREELKKLYKDN
jgi:5'-3' exonuclease